MRVRFSNQQSIKVSQAEIRKLAEYALTLEGIGRAKIEISILLVDNARVKELNKEYLGRKRATDVISFRMWEGPFYKLHPEILGDVVVSVEQAHREARRLGKEFKQELWLYIIHGLLHLVGYEDDTSQNAKKMHKRCLEILKGWSERYAGEN